jgi:predicted alpha/beta-hydrolase family hydrolase
LDRENPHMSNSRSHSDGLLIDGARDTPTTVLLAHGAGAPMDSPFMNIVAAGLGREGIGVARFEFPYMHSRRTNAKRGAPDREPVLIEAWREVIARLGAAARLVIGGKSMGGRIASMVADEAGVRGLVCLGYPFHPPGRPERLRVKHLETLRTPALIVQGTRDQLGSREDVEKYKLSPSVRLAWIDDGDHSFKPRARSGRTEAQNLAAAVCAVSEFVKELSR